MKKALIFGVTGQDGAYLAKFLIKKGYIVHGVKRRSSSLNSFRIDDIYSDPLIKKNRFYLHYGDITDSISVYNLINNLKPKEVYNLAAQSHVAVSFKIPEYTTNTDSLGTLRILEAVRKVNKKIKFYQAGSSEMYGKVQSSIQSEKTPFYPRSPYAVAKLYSYWIVRNYREAYGIFCSNGILFNHESHRRGKSFITKKVISQAIKIINNQTEKMYLGNLYAKRDWGYAPEYTDAMWRILQYKAPDDFVIATGETHTVKELVEETFRNLNDKIVWVGEGIDEKGILESNNKVVVEIDPYYFRPTEVNLLIGNPKKSKDLLNWEANTKFKELVKIMVEDELKAFKK